MTPSLTPGRRTVQLVAALAVIGLLGACAAGPNTAAMTGADPAGFWLGLWQGLISPITFIVSLFNDKVNIYEVHNNGNWYNFGFMLGVMMVFSGGGGGAAGRSSRSSKRSSPQDAA